MRGWRIAAAVVVLAAAGVAVVAGGASGSPTNLYTTLLTTKLAPQPDGYYSAKVGVDTLGDRDKKHHAIGRVIVTLDSDAALEYTVFPTWPNARDRMAEKPKPDKDTKINFVGKVPGLRKQSIWINGTVTGKNVFGKTVSNGLTLMCARSDIVIYCAATFSTDSDESGDVPESIKLLHVALKHLNAVRAKP